MKAMWAILNIQASIKDGFKKTKQGPDHFLFISASEILQD